MSNVYLVDVGVLLNKNECDCSYSSCYDRKHGYYDENQYLVKDLEEAKKEALEYVADGVENTYAVVSCQGELPDEYDDGFSYDVENVVFSAVKRNGTVIESFIKASND